MATLQIDDDAVKRKDEDVESESIVSQLQTGVFGFFCTLFVSCVCAPCPCRLVFVRALTLAMLFRLFRARVHRRHVQGARDSGRARLHRVFDSVLAADFVSARLFDAHQVSVE